MADMMDVDIETTGGWKEGEFQLVFFSIGQGDCCAITCPDGQCILIDCGSKSWEEEHVKEGKGAELKKISDDIKENIFNEKHKYFETIILTHPDQDHYNQLKKLFEIGIPKKVDTIYFSSVNLRKDMSPVFAYKDKPLLEYNENAVSSFIYDNLDYKKLICITTHAPKNIDVCTWKKEDFLKINFKTYEEVNKIDQDMIPIAKNKTKNGLDWHVSIVASNIKYSGNSDDKIRNTGSVVTFIEIGKNKILICGDATDETFDYLNKHFSNQLNKLDLLQAPHHGSQTSKKFINFKPKRVVISTQKREHTHKLPRDYIKNYYEPLIDSEDKEPTHKIQYWSEYNHANINEFNNYWDKYNPDTNDLFISASTNRRGSERYWIKKDKEDTGDIIAFFGKKSVPREKITKKRYILHQETTIKSIVITALQEHRWYYFNGETQ